MKQAIHVQFLIKLSFSCALRGGLAAGDGLRGRHGAARHYPRQDQEHREDKQQSMNEGTKECVSYSLSSNILK